MHTPHLRPSGVDGMEAITKILAEMRFQAVSKVSSPLELLDSQEGGYVLGIACAMLLPGLRGVLRFAVFEVLRFSSPTTHPAVYPK